MLGVDEMWVLAGNYEKLANVLIPPTSSQNLPVTFTQYFAVDDKYFRYVNLFGIENGRLEAVGLRCEIRACPRAHLEKHFPPALLAEFTITPNELIVPLSQLEVIANYTKDEFPLHFPTPTLIFVRMASLLHRLSGTFWVLDEKFNKLTTIITTQAALDASLLPPIAHLTQTAPGFTSLTNPVDTYASLWLQYNSTRRFKTEEQLQSAVGCTPLRAMIVNYMLFERLD